LKTEYENNNWGCVFNSSMNFTLVLISTLSQLSVHCQISYLISALSHILSVHSHLSYVEEVQFRF